MTVAEGPPAVFRFCPGCGGALDVRERLTVGIGFAGQVGGGQLAAGDDLDRVAFFPLIAPPEPLAFPTDRRVLAEFRAGVFERIPDSKRARRGANAPGHREPSARMPACRAGG
jgi:hypothetical protein